MTKGLVLVLLAIATLLGAGWILRYDIMAAGAGASTADGVPFQVTVVAYRLDRMERRSVRLRSGRERRVQPIDDPVLGHPAR